MHHLAMIQRLCLQVTFPLQCYTSVKLSQLDQKLSVRSDTEMLMFVKTSTNKPLNVITKNRYAQVNSGNVYMAQFRHMQRFLVLLERQEAYT